MGHEADGRSMNCVFISHCLLAQAVRAAGLAKHHPAAVKPLVQFLLDHEINIMQMPCPELQCASGGLGRLPHGKSWYLQNGLRETSSEIAKGQVAYMKTLTEQGFNILAVIGMEFSPACAVTYLNRGPVIYKDQGVYIEELQRQLGEAGLSIPFLGVNMRAHRKLQRDLQDMVSKNVSSPDTDTTPDEDVAPQIFQDAERIE